MSPASQGNFEIEHYIGTNLISSCARINNSRTNGKGRKTEGKLILQRANANSNTCNGDVYHGHHIPGHQGYTMANPLACNCRADFNAGSRPAQFGTANWTGIPLISVADSKKKNQQWQDRSKGVGPDDDSNLRMPLSRLAIHTQGAPLILAGRCYNSRKNQNRANQSRGGEVVIRRSEKYKDSAPHDRRGPSDCLSVASDESSGSGHSENCLPRIIKPRKRRKKDRKPLLVSNENYVEGKGGSVLDMKKSEGDKILDSDFDFNKKAQAVLCDTKPNPKNSNSINLNGSQRDEGSEDEYHGPELHHTFEDVTESDPVSYGWLPSSCQCHYCDPSGIWDDPADAFPMIPVKNSRIFSTPGMPKAGDKMFHYFPTSDLVLRRSWSDPVADLNEKGKWDPLGNGLSSRSRSFSKTTSLSPSQKNSSWSDQVNKSWGLRMSSKESGTTDVSNKHGEGAQSKKFNEVHEGQCLEVSTEIVTSPNGHRDIEIRFYTTTVRS